MPPVQGQPQSQGNDAVLAAIQSLKGDITAEIDRRFQEQQSTFDERLKPVDAIQETLEEARKRQAEALEQQQQQQQGEYKPQTWQQLRADAANDAYARMEQERKTREAKEERTRQLTAQEEAQLEADIDRQLTELERDGYLPPVGNPNDYNDPGVATRRELLAAASYMGTPELDKVAGSLAEMHKHDMVFDAQTKTYRNVAGTVTPLPGKYAPVGNSSTHAPTAWAGPSAGEIHNMSMDELAQLAQTRGYGPVPTTAYNDTGF